ncbi:hypothetical protein JL722_7191 [Aureococcus anophagefferens]|nr:hypothetical protein JL722_7191 [Aureococcus anophagefferens]
MEDERSAGQRRRRLRLGAALVGCGLALMAVLRTSDGAAPPNLSQAQEARHEASIGAIGYPSEDDGTVDASSDGVATVDATAAGATARQSSRGLDWSVYKFTVPVGNGSVWDLYRLANATLGPVTVSSLGCDGYKASATMLGDNGAQLHWVEAPRLSNDPRPIDAWEDYWTALNGNLTRWNAFLHAKATLYTDDFGPTVEALRAFRPRLPLLYRRSRGYAVDADHPDWTGDVGHAIFPIRGRAYEVVGPVDKSWAARESPDAWPEWRADECPAAHRLDDDLGRYARTFAAFSGGAAIRAVNVTSPSLLGWAADRGFWPPMLLGVAQVATAAFVDDLERGAGALAVALENVTAQTFAVERSGDGLCAVATADTVATWTDFKLPVRYVHNGHHAERYRDGWAPADFVAYVDAAHRTIAGSYDDWAGWDHWLDWHVGLKYGPFETSAACAELERVESALLAVDAPAGQRNETGEIHDYAGLAGADLGVRHGPARALRAIGVGDARPRREHLRVPRGQQRPALPRGHGPRVREHRRLLGRHAERAAVR